MLNLFRLKIFWKFFVSLLLLTFTFIFIGFLILPFHWFSICLFGLFFAFVVAFFATKNFYRSFSPLIHSVQAMTKKEWNVRAPVFGDDEWTFFSREINKLSDTLSSFSAEMQEESKQLRVILDSMSEGVMVLNEEGEIILTNAALSEVFSLESSPLGFTPLELIRNPELQELIEEIVSQKKSIEREIEIRSNPLKQVRVYAAPLKERENLKGTVLVFHDITSLRHLENLRKEFVANVSHELKTPLTAIKGYTETLLGGALNDPEHATKFLKTIHEHTGRLSDLLHDLLDLSKIESGQYEVRFEEVEIEPILKELVSTFSQALKNKEIHFDFSKMSIRSIRVDRLAFRQILSNLLENAIKYSNRGGKIIVQAEEKSPQPPFDKGGRGGIYQFSLEDNGPGISKEQLPRIFERFYRTDSSRSRELGGTGLGLSIVKHLVQLHGGEIRVESELGKGSKFIIEIPKVPKK